MIRLNTFSYLLVICLTIGFTNFDRVFKNLEKLYYRLYKLIKYTKDIPSSSAGSTLTCPSPSSVNSNRTSVIRVESIEGSDETASEDKSDKQDESVTLVENQTMVEDVDTGEFGLFNFIVFECLKISSFSLFNYLL